MTTFTAFFSEKHEKGQSYSETG